MPTQTYISVPRKVRDGSRTIAGLPGGMYFWVWFGVLCTIGGETLVANLSQARSSLCWRKRTAWSKKLKRLRDWYEYREPIDKYTIGLMEPWDLVISSSKPEYIRAFVVEWVKLLIWIWEWYSGRRVLGVAVHLDAGTIHCDIYSTRMDGDQFIKGTVKAFHMLGPSATGVLRQVNARFRMKLWAKKPKNAIKALKKFVKENKRPPLDVLLGFESDNLCEIWWGQSPGKRPIFEWYDGNWKYNDLGHILSERKALVELLGKVRAHYAKAA